MRPVEIVDYDPSWPALFAAERDGLRALLGDLVDDIHHIGSTSVPGLAAKPKIDMDAVIRSADARGPEAVERMRKLADFAFHGDPFGDGRWTFTRGYGSYGIRLYLCAPDNRAHIDRMLFRDWLRTHREDAVAYEALEAPPRLRSQRRLGFLHRRQNGISSAEIVEKARLSLLPRGRRRTEFEEEYRPSRVARAALA